jgi:hypothetical protein
MKMIAEFLTFDEANDFGKVFIKSDRLFELFVAKKHLSANVAYVDYINYRIPFACNRNLKPTYKLQICTSERT